MTTVTTQPLPPCVDCGRPMRGAHTLLADQPGTVMVGNVERSLCQRCAKQGDPAPMTNLRSEQPSWPAQPQDWMAQALCAEIDPDLWYPDPGDAATARAAVAVCGVCPVRAECLDYAMATETQGGRHGVWGGLIPNARDRLWHEQRKEAA